MNMTEWEICRDYRVAKDKPGQIKILADMNCCGKHVIQELLAKNGLYHGKINAPKARAKKPRKKQMLRHSAANDFADVNKIVEKKERAERRVPTRWTEKEIEMADKLYRQGYKPAYIAQILGRTGRQITEKIYELNKKKGRVTAT